MASGQKPEQITSLQVSKLFGRFNHELIFPEEQDISIITAPNGYGKTVLLRIIDSIFNRKWSFFSKIEFDEITIGFASGKSILIHKNQPEPIDHENTDKQRTVLFQPFGFGPEDETYHFSFSLSPSDLRFLERHLPVEPVGSDRWFDMHLERELTTVEVIEVYADQLPQQHVDSLEVPEWLQNAIGSVDAHLVETQRLLYLAEQEKGRPHGRHRRVTPPSVVEKDATDLAEHIGHLLQQYANASQKLDQTFPERILAFHDGPVSDETEIRTRLEELSEKRKDLVSVGLLGTTISQPIQPSNIFKEESIRRILSIYVRDTKQKLSIFDDIYAKIRLFKQILDEHFSFKKISIDHDGGFSAIDNSTGETIPLSELSSGEQHELVLVYELLFKVKEGSVILVDEPELSLHVSWQKRFIANLQKIQNLKKLKIIIATHSPQIINDKWDLVQELKTETEDE